MSNHRILIFDIETSPNVGYFWRPGYNITIGPENIIEERQIICISYKWVGEKKVHSLYWDYGKKKGDRRDRALLKKFSKIFNKADSVVGHNGDNYDIKWLHTRILKHGLEPLHKVHQFDTLKACKRHFNLNSNKLDYVSKFLGNSGKDHMCFDDWKKVMSGDDRALNKMVKYCEQDVLELEKVYLILRPHVTGTLSAQAVTKDRDACPSCGNKAVIKYGTYYTKVGRYQKYRCGSCCHTYRDNRMLKDK